MYRDLIGDPEKIESGGRAWWMQELCRWDGTVKAVNLFDDAGKFVGEFQSREDALAFAQRAETPRQRDTNAL